MTASLSIVATASLWLGGCAHGPRERCQAAREALVPATPGSTDVAYFDVLEDPPRTSLAQPVTATAAANTDIMGIR